MPVNLTLSSVATCQETPSSGVDAAAQSMVTHDGFNITRTLNADSTPPVTNCVYRTLALVLGALTIDVTTITGLNGAVQDGTGKKVQYFRVQNTGANVMTFSKGASDGYAMAGSAWSIDVPPGGHFEYYAHDGTPPIGGSAKTIDVAGTGTQAFKLSLSMG